MYDLEKKICDQLSSHFFIFFIRAYVFCACLAWINQSIILKKLRHHNQHAINSSLQKKLFFWSKIRSQVLLVINIFPTRRMQVFCRLIYHERNFRFIFLTKVHVFISLFFLFNSIHTRRQQQPYDMHMVQLKTDDRLSLNCCQKYTQCMGKSLVSY